MKLEGVFGSSDIMCPSIASGACNSQDPAYIPKYILVCTYYAHAFLCIFLPVLKNGPHYIILS